MLSKAAAVLLAALALNVSTAIAAPAKYVTFLCYFDFFNQYSICFSVAPQAALAARSLSDDLDAIVPADHHQLVAAIRLVFREHALHSCHHGHRRRRHHHHPHHHDEGDEELEEEERRLRRKLHRLQELEDAELEPQDAEPEHPHHHHRHHHHDVSTLEFNGDEARLVRRDVPEDTQGGSGGGAVGGHPHEHDGHHHRKTEASANGPPARR